LAHFTGVDGINATRSKALTGSPSDVHRIANPLVQRFVFSGLIFRISEGLMGSTLQGPKALTGSASDVHRIANPLGLRFVFSGFIFRISQGVMQPTLQVSRHLRGQHLMSTGLQIRWG
jgi:TolB-like protein